MEKQTNTSLTLITLLLGGAVGVGAGYLVSRACGVCSSVGRKEKTIAGRNDEALNTPYCAVPEGADICYPDQAGS